MDQVTTISLFVLFFALCLPVLHRLFHRWPSVYKLMRYVIFIVYMIANLYETILFRAVQPAPTAKWELLWSYRRSLSFADGVTVTDLPLLVEILLNILLYIPLGYLLPFLWPALRPKESNRFLFRYISLRIVLIGFLCSCATEISQYIFRIGLFEFDDILNNTFGCLLGCMLFEMLPGMGKRKETKRC